MNKSLTALLVMAATTGIAHPAAASEDYFGGFSVRSHAHLLSPFDLHDKFALHPADPALAGQEPTQIRVGYAYSPRFAMEAEYARSGSMTRNAPSLLPVNARGVGLDAVGALPMWAGLTVLGRAGIRRVIGEADPSQLQPNGVLNQAKVGLGLQYQFSRSLGFRADVERYRNIGADRTIADSDGDIYSLGVYWRF